MTSSMAVFRRPVGDGWLWIAGGFRFSGGESASVLAAMEETVGRLRQAVVLNAGTAGTPDLSALQGWTGAEVKTYSISRRAFPSLATVDLAILIGDDLDAWLDSYAEGEAEDALLEGLGRGMHIVAVGAAAEAMGSWAWSPRAEEYVGALGWLPGAIVLTGEAAKEGWGSSRSVLARRRKAYALAVYPGNLVGLGPGGEMRLTGDPAPKLLLGPGWGGAATTGTQEPPWLERP